MKWLILALFVVGAVGTRIDSRIVGGAMASISMYPWQGALLYNMGFTCGCVLISDTVILTAAHCVDGREVAWVTPHFSVYDSYLNPKFAQTGKQVL